MCRQQVGGGHHPFFESYASHAQVLFRPALAFLGQREFLHCLIHGQRRLVHLQRDFFARFLQLQSRHGCIGLGGGHFVLTFAPFPDGNLQQQPHTPGAFQLFLEAVEHTRIGHAISARQGQGGEEGRALHLHLLGIDRLGEPQLSQFGAGTHGCLRVGLHAGRGSRQVAEAFVNEVQRGVDRQSAKLSQKHAREAQTVLGTRQRHLGFVQLDAHRQRIGTGGHAFFHHFLHVAVQMLQHVAVGRSQTRLVRQAHHLPVSFVHTENHLLAVGTQLFAGQLLGIAGDTIVGANFSTHVERLGEEYRTHGHIACVGLEALRQIAPHAVQSLLQSGAGLLRALHERGEIGVGRHELLHPLQKFGRKPRAQLRTEVG